MWCLLDLTLPNPAVLRGDRLFLFLGVKRVQCALCSAAFGRLWMIDFSTVTPVLRWRGLRGSRWLTAQKKGIQNRSLIWLGVVSSPELVGNNSQKFVGTCGRTPGRTLVVRPI